MNSVRSLRSLTSIYSHAIHFVSYAIRQGKPFVAEYECYLPNGFSGELLLQIIACLILPGQGLNILIPFLDRIKFVQNLREIAIEIPQQGAITLDNVQLQLDGVLYLRVFNPYRASYGVDDPEFAVTQLAQTTMRSEVGKISLDTVFKEREQLNVNIVEAINKAAEPWGIKCMRYEIRDMHMPEKIQEAMQMQVEAERKKRAAILESEGHRESAINKAEGEKRAKILESEAREAEQINVARGQAEALRINAEAKAQAIERIATALNQTAEFPISFAGLKCQRMVVNGCLRPFGGQQYVEAFQQLAKKSNTVILPANLSEPSSMVAQALTCVEVRARNRLNKISDK
ncbi:SPFH/Band 7/PHB domain protein [Cooperia oncophora]